jgi:PAS domain S-box-containing protein
MAFRRVTSAAELRKHSYQVLSLADVFLSALRDAETGQRGYAITGDERFLEPYLAVRAGVPGQLRELRQLTSIASAQELLDAVAPLADAKLAEMALVIELRRNHDVIGVQARVSSGRGKWLMDSIRAEMTTFTKMQKGVPQEHEAKFQSDMRTLLATIVVGCLTALALALMFAYLVYRQTQQRQAARTHLETKRQLTIQDESNRLLQLANNSLLESEERLAVTLNCIGDAVISTDTEARVTRLNPVAERLTGWTQAESLGRPVDEILTIVSKTTREPVAIPVAETLRGGKAEGLANQAILIARNGNECDIADSCAPIRDRSDQLVGAVMVFRNVTAENAAQQELEDAKSAAEHANRAKSDFLSKMSHELRSPLNAILGFAQLMESDSPSPTNSQKESIAQILQAGWHLLNLINEILDLATIEAGKLSLSTEPISATEVMSECRTMLLPDAQKRGISMTFPGGQDPLFVSADRTRFKQIVINLVFNAIKYNRKQGTVKVECSTSTPERTRISVTDTGVGLSPEKVAQLFQPFNRLGQQEPGGVAGTGIGLVMTQRLVELMGGVLGVESTAGVGSVFWFELPSSVGPLLGVESTAAEIHAEMPVPPSAL